MEKLIWITALFLALTVYAQEMDTTYVVDENGETIGLIHEKGVDPLMYAPAGTPAVSNEVQNTVPAENSYASMGAAPAQNVNVSGNAIMDDSTAYYQNLVDRYNTSGTKLRRVGKGMMLGGGLGAALGVTLMFVGACDTESDYYGDDVMTDSGEAKFVIGYVMTLSGTAVFTTGMVLKMVGSGKIRRARRYEDKLEGYRIRNALKLTAVPTYNPVNGAVGGAMALAF